MNGYPLSTTPLSSVSKKHVHLGQYRSKSVLSRALLCGALLLRSTQPACVLVVSRSPERHAHAVPSGYQGEGAGFREDGSGQNMLLASTLHVGELAHDTFFMHCCCSTATPFSRPPSLLSCLLFFALLHSLACSRFRVLVLVLVLRVALFHS